MKKFLCVLLFQFMFHDTQHTTGPSGPVDGGPFCCFPDPVFNYGVLPAGQYRLIKTFNMPDQVGKSNNLEEEFAIAYFTVEETLDWQTTQDW